MRIKGFITGALLGLLPLATLQAATQEQPLTDDEFAQCVGRLQTQAREAGLSEPVVENVLGKVQFNPKIITYDRRQPEFVQTFAGYFNARVTENRVMKGRELMKEHADLLREITRKTGVPGRYLLAFWGLETNFGRYFGKLPVMDSLATLACDQRRSDFFSRELLNALRIVDRGDVSAEKMVGSWAGALGHMQFMPSVYLRYAHDADNDGRRDLWGSLPDALTSAGYFLKGLGWQPELRWGREVVLPEGFAYELAGLGDPKPLSFWREKGVKTVFGGPLPQADVKAELLVPAGHKGPAFLVYRNFHVIMGWNQSEFYALSVGVLADRIAGAGRLKHPPPTDTPRLSRATVTQLQEQLQAAGFDPGPVDGILGPGTRSAIRSYQAQKGWIADGFPHPKVLSSLGIQPKSEE
ncbi:lytic murein transglycosylase [Marinobacteraceae bacterium S3BR75-40.1]